MKNPNKPLRIAYINALNTATGLPVWGKKVPNNVIPVPLKYILIGTQSKQMFAETKKCYEWICQVQVNIYLVNPVGNANTNEIDNLEELVLNAIQSGINVSGFKVKFTRLLDQTDLDAETATQSVERRILTYEHWLNRP